MKAGGDEMVYWGDLLDLQAPGPIPWRKGVEEGIANRSKCGAFVDKAWLSSYKCLQVPGGSSEAKAEHDAQHVASPDNCPPMDESHSGPHAPLVPDLEPAVYMDEEFRHALCTYAGKEIVPGRPMSLHVMQDVQLICVHQPVRLRHPQRRPGERGGLEAVAGTAPLPLLLKDEAVFWTVWLKGAEDHNLNPRPTDGMKEPCGLAERSATEAAVTASDSAKATVAVLCSTKFATVSFAGDRDLRSLACGSEDTTLRVWQVGQDCAVDSLAPQLLQGHSGTLNSVAWAPRGRSLASRA
eukprot:jgi/Tetstr1/445015/TSEL_032823.t1